MDFVDKVVFLVIVNSNLSQKFEKLRADAKRRFNAATSNTADILLTKLD